MNNGERFAQAITEAHARNNAWRASAEASLACRKALAALLEEAIEATASGRELGMKFSIEDRGDAIMWTNGCRRVTFGASHDRLVLVSMKHELVPSRSTATTTDPATVTDLTAWATDVAENAVVFLMTTA